MSKHPVPPGYNPDDPKTHHHHHEDEEDHPHKTKKQGHHEEGHEEKHRKKSSDSKPSSKPSSRPSSKHGSRRASAAAAHQPYATLNDGKRIPLNGFGTWQAKPGEVYKAVLEAIKVGYRHLDFAKVYGNQKEIKAALQECGVPREELFLTSKLWNNAHHPDLVEKALDDTLEELGLEYLDLYLIHWPVAFANEQGDVAGKTSDPPDRHGDVPLDLHTSLLQTWTEMINLKNLTKKVRSIGVSNFSPIMIQTLQHDSKVYPAVNQIERHPRLVQDELIEYCKMNHIHVTAYSPLGNNSEGLPLLTEHETIVKIADQRKFTPAQVLVAWGLHEGGSVLTKSVTPSRIAENFHLVLLHPADVKKINDIGEDEYKRFNVPYNYKPRWDINVFNEPEEKDAHHMPKLK